MLKSILKHGRSLNSLGAKTIRNLSVETAPINCEENDRMKTWQVHSYGEDPQCVSLRIPIVQKPSELLIKVEASSINPIDVAMKDGYGRTILKFFKCQDNTLPMTLGRDFSGVIADRGHSVDGKYKCGDKVYGIIPFHKDGAHAEYCVVDESYICHCPEETVNHTEAASLPYAAITAWSALWITGGIYFNSIRGKKVLVLGASGGVGTCAVQMLKAYNASVYATCASDAEGLLERLGANCVFDYKDKDFVKNVGAEGRYEIILDCAQVGHNNIPKTWEYGSYITLNSPLLHNTDNYGLVGGLAYSAANIIPANITSLSKGQLVKWAYIIPCKEGMEFVNDLIKTCKLLPTIDSIFPFDKTIDAYNKTKAGHIRGKVVIDMRLK